MGKIECKPYDTAISHPQSNGFEERMMQTIKTALKACFQRKERIEVFLPRLLLRYRTIPHAGRLESPSALRRRQIRVPLETSYSTNEKISYKKNKDSNPERAEFIMQKRPQYSYNKQRKGEQYISPCRLNKAPGRIWRAIWWRNLDDSFC